MLDYMNKCLFLLCFRMVLETFQGLLRYHSLTVFLLVQTCKLKEQLS